jgi:hypothetical protein
MSKNLNSKLKKKENYTCDPSKRGIEGSSGVLRRGLYGERPGDCTNYVNYFFYKMKLDKLSIYETLMCGIPKMCC